MRAATIVDGTITVRDRPDPVAGTGEVLVRVRAAGLNGADLMQVEGHYPPPPGIPPDIPGLEVAGEVVAVGPKVTRFSPGDRVMSILGGAGQAELAVVHERVAMPVPAIPECGGVPWDQAGGFPEVFSTAHDALFSQCHLSMGERLLVHGAAGGVGSAAVQLGVATGARVTATVRNPALREAVSALGATVVAPEDFVDHGPFDVVIELVGAPNLAADVAALAVNGRVVVIGIGAGSTAEVDLRALMGCRGTIRSSTLRPRPLEEKALLARRVEAGVIPLLAAGRVRVPVAATFPLAEVAAAYSAFAAGGKFGKIVLLMGDLDHP
ncbi:MAG: NADPH:quinone reductase [Actinomycetota bacterium]|nr:NADPH:quinone reductase [Actinomycetota bacterium]